MAWTPSKHSRRAYSGLVPMSPKTTPRAERMRTPARERRWEVTAPSVRWTAAVRPSHLLIAALLVHAVAFAISAAQSGQPAGDFDRYYEIGHATGRPYVDYQIEHPIGALLVLEALAPAGRAGFGLAVVILNLLADAVIIGSLIWGWGIAAAAFGAVALIPVLGLFFNRVDAWPTAAAILAVAAWRRDRPLTLGGAIAIGAAFKLWPIVLTPLLLVPWRERRSIAALTVFAATALAFAGLMLKIAGA